MSLRGLIWEPAIAMRTLFPTILYFLLMSLLGWALYTFVQCFRFSKPNDLLNNFRLLHVWVVPFLRELCQSSNFWPSRNNPWLFWVSSICKLSLCHQYRICSRFVLGCIGSLRINRLQSSLGYWANNRASYLLIASYLRVWLWLTFLSLDGKTFIHQI